jgi:hypothetical protein
MTRGSDKYYMSSRQHHTSSSDLSKPKTRVLCVGSQTFFDGISWALEQKPDLASEVELVWRSLSNLSDTPAGLANVAITSVDLGQPIPIESLRQLGVFVGLVACVQPTPMQLLSIGAIGRWTPVEWEGTDYSKLLMRVSSLVDQWRDELRKENVFATLSSWLSASYYEPSQIEWINPPKSYLGPTKFVFDRRQAVLSVGGLASDAHVKLAINTKETFFECVFRGDQWIYRKITSSNQLQGVESGSAVEIGDQVFVGELNLQVTRSEELAAVERLTRPLRGGDIPVRHRLDTDSSFFEVVKYFLSSQVSGELRVRGPVKQASLFFSDGYLQQVFCGSISGRKALLRVMSWPGLQWKFVPDSMLPKLSTASLGIGLGDFLEMYMGWLFRWRRVASIVPPGNIRVRVKASTFAQVSDWDNTKYEVIARVCEYGRIAEILNNTPLDDIDIYETLIDLRRSGLIEAYQ